MTVGLPASGKSTFVKELLKKENRWKRVSRDDIRLMIDNVAFDPRNEGFVTKVEDAIVIEALRSKHDVVIDATHLNPQARHRWVKFAKQWGDIRLRSKNFDVPLAECIERDKGRAASVGGDVIKRMFDRYVKKSGFPTEIDEYFPHPAFDGESQNTDLPRAIICDLDGTLADNSWRDVYDASDCTRDPVIGHVHDIVNFHLLDGTTVFFITGRESKFRDKTIEFLEAAGFDFESDEIALYMRGENDRRRDTIVKKEIYNEHIKDKYFVKFAMDDRPSVCRMWRYEVGIPVLQVADKEF